MKTCDLHGYFFEEGKDLIIKTMNECIMDGDPNVEIIHGHHGHVFKDYIESEEFYIDMETEGICLEISYERPNPGVTMFKIENIYQEE